MFKNMGLKGKIYTILGLPLMGMIVFVGFSLYEENRILSSAGDIQTLSGFAQRASELVHELQAERGMSAGYIGSGGKTFSDDLAPKRQRTDKALQAIMALLKGFDPAQFGSEFAGQVQEAMKNLDQLQATREGVSALNITAGEAVAFYSGINENLLTAIKDIALISTDPAISQMLGAYDNLLQAKERAGIERAVLSNVFAKGAISGKEFERFTSLVVLQNSFLGTFGKMATDGQKQFYNQESGKRFNSEVERMRAVVSARIEKEEILNKVSNQIGFGGMIHQFKNMVIRGEASTGEIVTARVRDINTLLDEFLELPGVSDAEKGKIGDIRNVVNQYAGQVGRIASLAAEGASVRTLDRAVRIDDTPALEALAFLQKGNFGIRSEHWFEQASQRINMLKALDDRVAEDLVAYAGNLYESSLITFIVILTAALAIVLVTVVIGVFITRGLLRSVNEMIGGLYESANQTLSASEQLASSSMSLSEGASEQAASLEETSSTVEELNSMTKNNAENAQQVDDLSVNASQSAQKGVEAMQRMIVAINEIKTSSDETAKIIKTIDEIAFQTNLLALNAAVEAARAGDAGRGFAVVAEEVRNLAQRSAEAARSTSEMIEESQRKADNGVNVGTEVDSALGEISTSINEVTGLIKEVAQASNEQARGLEQVSTALAQMDKVTQGNAASAEENSASSEQLTSQAQMLQGVVENLAALIYGASHDGRSDGVASPDPAPERISTSKTDSARLAPPREEKPKGRLKDVISKNDEEEVGPGILPRDYQGLDDEDFKPM